MRGRHRSLQAVVSRRFARPLAEPAECRIYLVFMTAEMKLATRDSGVLQLFIHDTVT
jgi:hypothetical protein